MITAALAAGSAIAGLGSSILGGIKSAKRNRRANKLIARQRDDNRNWYEKKMAEDFTLRPDAQAAISRQRELLDEQYRKARASAVVGGGTPEAEALAKEAGNRSLAETMGNIAAHGAAAKDAAEQSYMAHDAALNQQQAQQLRQDAAASAQAGAQAANAGLSLAGGIIGNSVKPKKLEA